MLKICNRIIEYSFYAIFLLVPLAFTSSTSELFELNKMWLTWGLTIIITASWLIKMVLQKRILLCRTPLDIPIGLFLLSQIISTIFSLDPHISLWGYYSRFNGGLFSIISYILLYYAFLSNFPTIAKVQRLLTVSLISGLIVALWGLPSHFGYDPTCLIFRGNFDVSCWTDAFQPKVRIFSTLGQPDWLAAYLAVLIPITIAFFINNLKSSSSEIEKKYHVSSITYQVFNRKFIHATCYMLLTTLFYVDLLFTRARSGFLGIWFALIFFATAYYFAEIRNKKPASQRGEQEIRKNLKSLIINPLSLIIGLMLLVTFVIGSPIGQLNKFASLEGIGSYIKNIQTAKTLTPAITPAPSSPSIGGGTESADIRLLVWTGALNAWKSNPIFGTGVETFAFAYYKYKPVGQNLTSEWDYLYNKAHNEYLNYLATTGIVGLGSYLLMIGTFIFIFLKNLKSKITNPKQAQNHNNQNSKHFENSNLFGTWNFDFGILPIALLAAYISILITNFFGFSVVITNIYLFMIPAFVFILTGILKTETRDNKEQAISELSPTILTGIFFILIACSFLLITLFNFWQADISFALGSNLNQTGESQRAYPNLHKAVQLRSDEPVFKDDLAINNATIATALVSQNATASAEVISVASSLAQEAINTSNEIISQHPNNVVFWKTRTKLFLTLSQVDSRYLPRAMDAIEKAALLAPNDARILYNLGVLYGQNNNLDKGISVLEKTIILKPDYRDAHFGLGFFYHQKATDKTGNVIDPVLQQKAVAQMQYILDNISPKDTNALKSIEEWARP